MAIFRVVLDTNVVVAAIRSDRGASRALLIGALESHYRLLLSVPLMLEYESVLTRDDQLEAFGLRRDGVEAILDAMTAVAEPVRLAYLWRPTLADSQDDMVLETAVSGRTDVLVTLNARHFRPAAERFAIDVVAPAVALHRMRQAK